MLLKQVYSTISHLASSSSYSASPRNHLVATLGIHLRVYYRQLNTKQHLPSKYTISSLLPPRFYFRVTQPSHCDVAIVTPPPVPCLLGYPNGPGTLPAHEEGDHIHRLLHRPLLQRGLPAWSTQQRVELSVITRLVVLSLSILHIYDFHPICRE